jgi:hypothetical protein
MDRVQHLSNQGEKIVNKTCFAGDPNFWGNMMHLAQIDILGTFFLRGDILGTLIVYLTCETNI